MTDQNGPERSSATDELRRMLDERGVEYEGGERSVRWRDRNGVMMQAFPLANGELGMDVWSCTPEQAIAATLGSCNCSNSERTGTCRNISEVMDEHGQARFVCSECGAWIDSRMLWNPEYRNGESPWVSGCKLNYCPNCGRKVVTNG